MNGGFGGDMVKGLLKAVFGMLFAIILVMLLASFIMDSWY